MVAHKVAPAVATNNCMVCKPTELTPLTPLVLADILVEAGLPPEIGLYAATIPVLIYALFGTSRQLAVELEKLVKNVEKTEELIGILDERGISVHQKTCERFRSLKVRREDVVDLQWHLKKTAITKTQHLFVEEATRNRILMMLAVAPDKMKVADILVLSRIDTKKPAWEIIFAVSDLYGLKSILAHFDKSGLPYEFVIEQ